ncbi:MAG: DUF2809 domain-containing protein [Polyangiaceae bacterium]
MKHFRFHPRAAGWAVAIFVVECLIAAFVRDAWIRPFGGDVLAVILVFACLRSFLSLPSAALASLSFLVGVLVETFQWAELPVKLGIAQYPSLRIIVGTTFAWGDVGCYALGACIAWWVDRRYWVRTQYRPSDAVSS